MRIYIEEYFWKYFGYNIYNNMNMIIRYSHQKNEIKIKEYKHYLSRELDDKYYNLKEEEETISRNNNKIFNIHKEIIIK